MSVDKQYDDRSFDELANAYLDDALDQAGRERFISLLEGNPSAMQRLAELAQLNQMIDSEVAYLQQSERFDLPVEAKDLPAANTLAGLVKSEKNVEPGTRSLENISEAAMFKSDASRVGDRLSSSEIASIFWYLGRQPKVWVPLVAVLTLTASLLIVLMFVGGPSNGPQAPGVANIPTEPSPDDPVLKPNNPIVATLTAEYDAVWDRRPSKSLYANERFILAEGFAKITTWRGAVAILEAPATIELTDSPNAIRLHAGKLVGICETSASKGFVVHTPFMDIIDLGTRFGVYTDREATDVHVFEGEVEALESNQPENVKPTRIGAGMSARVSSDSGRIVRIDHSSEPYTELLPTLIRLPGTGFGLADGQVDTNWQVVSVDGQMLETPISPPVVTGGHRTQFHPNNPSTSQWLAWIPPAEEQTKDEHIYLVRSTVELPDAAGIEGTRLILGYMADNELRSVRVNGSQVSLPEVDVTGHFTTVHRAFITDHLVSGPNTLDFELVNLSFNGRVPGDAGIRVAMQLEVMPFSDHLKP